EGGRDDDALEDERQRCGEEEMRRPLDVRLPGYREGEDHGMQREHIEERIHAVLVEEEKTDEHEPAGEEMRGVEREGAQPHHRTLRVTNRRSTARTPSISPAPRKSGTRKTRILAMVVSKKPRRAPPAASLAR